MSSGYKHSKDAKWESQYLQSNKLVHLNTFSLLSLASFTLNIYFLFLLLHSRKQSQKQKDREEYVGEQSRGPSQEGFLSPTCSPHPPHSCQPPPPPSVNATFEAFFHAYSSHSYFLLFYAFPCFPLFYSFTLTLPPIHSVKFTISPCRQN